jgi:hypothetical protein
MKVFDLSKNYNFSDNLQENLKQLDKMFGKIFLIKFNNIEIKVELNLVKHKFNPVIKYYTLIHDIENRELSLLPLEISFIDIFEKKLNNNCYINYITKTNKVSGSNMIQLAINLCKCLNVKKSYLYDGATINCNNYTYDLSYLKLLQNNLTFYTKYGFEIDIMNDYYNISFKNKNEKNKYILNLIKSCKKVKNINIINLYKKILKIITKVIINQDYNSIKIYNKTPTDKIKWLNKIQLINLFSNFKDVIDLLLKHNDKYLYKTMIKLFNDKNLCSSYEIIEDNFIYNNMYEIIYKKKKINFKFLECFKLLRILNRSYYSYTYY